MIFGESCFGELPFAGRVRRTLARSKCPHCNKTISIPIDRLRSPGVAVTRRERTEARTPALVLAFE